MLITNRIRVDQFWDRNPFIAPWMEKYLPSNLMWADTIVSIFEICVSSSILMVLFHEIFPSDALLAITGLGSLAFILGSWNLRLARAQRRFYSAKKQMAKDA